MNGAQEKARLEEERRRQEVRVLCVASSLTLGSNWQLAKRWEGVASFVACAGRGGAPESPCGGRGSPGGRAKLRTSTRYKDQHIIDFVANGRRTRAWRRSGSDRRFHARLQSSLWWALVKMQAAAETRRQEEHRKVRKSNSMLQSTRSLSVWHVRRVLGSVFMLTVVTVCGRSKLRQRKRRAFAAEVIA